MTPNSAFDPKISAKKLLREALSGALATLMSASCDPYCSLVNVATAPDGAPLLLLSTLAVHTKNLLGDPRASLMLDERNASKNLQGDPLEGARVMLMGRVAAADDPTARSRYLARHPEAEQFAGFKDFAFYRMEVARAHLVAGFGRIVDLAGNDVLTDLTGSDALIEAEPSVIAHMNEDHAEALRLYATKLLGASDGEWRCTGCDPEGLDLRCGGTGLRVRFSQRVEAPGPLRAMLAQLAKAARAKSD
jgi:putative heme iron utilization protein